MPAAWKPHARRIVVGHLTYTRPRALVFSVSLIRKGNEGLLAVYMLMILLLSSSHAHPWRHGQTVWVSESQNGRENNFGGKERLFFAKFFPLICHSLAPAIFPWVSEAELCMAFIKFYNSNLSKFSLHGVLLTGLVGLAISYALSVTDRLSGMVTSFTETEKQMVSVERAVQYIEDIQPEFNPRGSVSIYLQARNVIRDRNS